MPVNGFNSDALAQLGIQGANAQKKANIDNDAALYQYLTGKEIDAGQKSAELKAQERHNKEMEAVAKQNAATTESYRGDQARNMEEQRRAEKLKLLIGGSGVGGVGTMSGEAQKISNLADTARSSLNNTEDLAKANPKTAAAQTALQSIPFAGDAISNTLAGLIGGKFKEVRDSKASTKEAMQNLYTGAAASGEQVPAFQGFAGPGALDIMKGNVDTSGNTRDAINNFQQRQQKAARPLSPEMLQAAGMQNDPIAQQAIAQQSQAQAAAKQQALSKLSNEDRMLLDEIQKNPAHPNAGKAMQSLKRRYGNIF